MPRHEQTGRSSGQADGLQVRGAPARLALLFTVVAAVSLNASLAVAADAAADYEMYTVGTRPHPGYDAVGVRLGSWVFLPSITSGVTYDSNIFSNADRVADDWIVAIRPSLNVRSEWSRHSVAAYARANFLRYSEFTKQDHADFFTGLSGTIDIDEGTKANLALDYAYDHEERGTGDSTRAFDDPIAFQNLTTNAAISKRFNRLTVSLGGTWQNLDYQDTTFFGVPVDQDYRDADKYTVKSRVAYGISPITSLFVEGSWNYRDRRGAGLDSTGWRGVAGLGFDLSSLVHGEVYGGYLLEDYEAGLSDISSYNYGGQLEWMPTPLTTVTLSGGRETDVSSFRGGASHIDSDVDIKIDHELLRNLVLSGRAGYAWNDYEGLGRTDEYIKAGTAATYLMNRYASFAADYSFQYFTSSGPGPDAYDRHKASVRVKLQY